MSQNIKKLKEGKVFIFGKKSHSAEKTERGDPLGFSIIHSVAKQQKKLKGDPLRRKKNPEKSLAVTKKIGRGYGILRGKTVKTFLVQFARPNSAIWCNNIL